jgi:cation diffusion facilitator CzcD-associated flavoprotein CzcO
VEQIEVAVVGSGFSGIGMGITLLQAGIDDFVLFEKDDDLGGTWRDNTYPGCACDIPSYLYSYSFEPNPDWSRMFAPWDEILDYLRRCADKYGVTPHIRFGTEVTEAEFDERAGRWTLTTSAGQVSARVLVTGVGILHQPRLPDIPGLGSFAGTTFHSARWRHDHDLTGRRVAAIGTGASAIQYVPKVAEQAAQLDVYQRTAPWVTPRMDRAVGPRERRLHARFPAGQRAIRDAIYLILELRGVGFAVHPRMMKALELQARFHLRRQVKDPGLRARLTPDYQIGCKRVLLSDDYYPALTRPNVELVTDRITRVTPDGVRTADGVERRCDTIVLGTGFELAANLTRMRITGRDGLKLDEEWKRDGMSAHLGMTVAGFPNLFLLTGPNTALGHSSLLFMVESQLRYVLQAIDVLRRYGGASYLEVREDVQRRFTGGVRGKLGDAVWQTGCGSWYLDDQGRNTAIWPHFTTGYWWRTRRLDPSDYALVQGHP